MTVTIDIPPKVEAALRRKAADAGQDLTGYIQRVAELDADGRPMVSPSLEEMLAGRIGIIDSAENMGGVRSRLSEDERAFGRYVEHRHQEGRLRISATQGL